MRVVVLAACWVGVGVGGAIGGLVEGLLSDEGFVAPKPFPIDDSETRATDSENVQKLARVLPRAHCLSFSRLEVHSGFQLHVLREGQPTEIYVVLSAFPELHSRKQWMARLHRLSEAIGHLLPVRGVTRRRWLSLYMFEANPRL